MLVQTINLRELKGDNQVVDKEQLLASVIIPVYKAEQYLPRCLDSVLAQTFQSFEVILIDDGSPDGSGKICDEYAAKDNRVQVYHQKNQGVTRTREEGIKKAQGKYIFWVDADDYVNVNLVEKVLNRFQETECDLVIFGWQEFQCGKITETRIWEKLSVEAWKKAAVNGRKGYLWDFVSPRDFWLNERAPEEMTRGAADGYMTVKLFLKAKTIEVLPDVLYYYERDNADSVTHDMSGKRCQGSAYLWQYRWHLSEKICPEALSYCVTNTVSGGVRAFSMGLYYGDLSDKEQNGLVYLLKETMKYSSYGHLRDRILRWGILHHQWWMCHLYARHKEKKEEKRKKRIYEKRR